MRKWQLGAAGLLLLATAAFFLLSRVLHQPALLNPPQTATVRVHYSDGRIETYPTSRLDEFKWIALRSQSYNPTFTMQLTLTAAAFVGLRKYAVPNSPTLVPLESHLRACGQYT